MSRSAPPDPARLVIANPRARGFATDPRKLQALERIVRGRAQIAVTERVSDIGGALDTFLGAGSDNEERLLILAGGDGAAMAALSALAPRLERGARAPRIGLLPFGTVGTVARNFGPRGASLDLLGSWLDEAERGALPKATPRPTVRVRERGAGSAESEEAQRLGFIFGTGLVARFFEAYEAGGASGIPLAARIVARIFAQSFTGGPLAKRVLTPMPLALEIDGARHPSGRYSLLCCSVVGDLGLRMRVNYRAGERRDRLHLVASSLSPERLGPRMPLVMMGRSIGGKDHVDQLVESFTLTFDAQGPYVLDGDMFHAREVTVSVGPTLDFVGP